MDTACQSLAGSNRVRTRLRPEGEHYELAQGEIITMAPERDADARAKFLIARRLADVLAEANSDCETFIDSLAVVVDDVTVYEPASFAR